MAWDEALIWLLNGLGVILAGAGFFFPVPAVLIACALVPWAALLAASLLRKGPPAGFWARRRDGPNLVMTFILPDLALGFWAAANYNFVDKGPVLILAASVTVILTGAMYMLFYRQLIPDFRVLLSVLLLGGYYGFGVVTLVDTVGDTNVSWTYHSTIAGKHSSGKGESWVLANGTMPSLGRLSGRIRVGDSVCIDGHVGRLKLRWYEVRRCPAAPNT